MKKTTFITALFLAISISISACKQQTGETSSAAPKTESSIQISADESSETISQYEPVTVSDISETSDLIEPEEPSEEESGELLSNGDRTIDDFQYIVVKDKCRLIRYIGTEMKVSVPARVTVDGKEYETEIGPGCFKDTDILLLTLPEHIKEIPESMCENCTKLSKVTFLNVESIGKRAFWKCENWKIKYDDLNVGTPELLKKIGTCAFAFSGLYGKVTIRPDMETEFGSFQVCMRVTKVEIQPGVTELPDCLFAESDDIQEIILPDTLKKIGARAFISTQVPSITVPQSVTEMGEFWISTINSQNKYKGIMLGNKGSAAEEYANKNNIVFSPID